MRYRRRPDRELDWNLPAEPAVKKLGAWINRHFIETCFLVTLALIAAIGLGRTLL